MSLTPFPDAIEALTTPQAYAASHAQRRLWTIAEMSPGSAEYALPGGLLLDGWFDRTAVRAALDALVERHESLRTTFDVLRGVVCQFVHSQAHAALEEIDLRHESDPAAAARKLADVEARRPFDLRRGPLFRVTLLTLADDRCVLLYNLHHIITDEFSNGVVIRELSLLYAAFGSGRPSPLPALELQYKDFAAWQNEHLTGREAEEDKQYWLQKFAGALPVLDLATDFPRPPVRTSSGASVLRTWEPTFLGRIEEFGRERNVTLFLVLVAVVRIHLFRSSGQEEIVIGVPVSSRDDSELEDQIGFYVDTLALRHFMRPWDTFDAVLEREKETFAEAFDHRLYPFDQLVSDLQMPRDASRTPVFQVSVQLQDAAVSGIELGHLRISDFSPGVTHAKLDLSYGFTRDETGLHCSLIYSADLFRAERAEAMLTQLRCLVENAIRAPGARIDRLEMLSEQDRRTVLCAFNETEVSRSEATIVSLFETCAASHAEAPAVIEDERTLTYSQLDAQANRLAHYFIQEGLGLESRVAVFLERSIDWVTVVLGILKAGAVYVPMDPASPRARLAQMLQDARAAAIVTTCALLKRLPSSATRVICLDQESLSASPNNPSLRLSEASVAYVIYTSGSTGAPKGVVIEHGGFANMIRDQIERLGVGREDRVLQLASVSFDASIWELFVALLAGACVVPIPRAVSLDHEEFRRFLAEHGVTLTVLLPSFLRSIGLQALSSLRLLVTAGEAAASNISREFARTRPCFNIYGPTEASVAAACHAIIPEKDYPFGIPIGRPLSNYRTYVLDPAMNPVPVGVRGELYLGGAGLARGYHDRPALTAASFVPDPFAVRPGGRLYRTGDLVRWNAEGELEFLGRADHQVKVRGRRIELGEVEAALNRLTGVREAVATVCMGTDGNQRLVAYLVPENGRLAAAALRVELGKTLPSGLVPELFVQLPAFKLNTAGKIDRRALPAPEVSAPEIAAGAAPRTDLERVLAGVFGWATGVSQFGIRDSFFDLGGNSLMATQAMSRIRDLLRVEISVTAFFESAGVEELAARLLADAPAPERLEKIAAAVIKFDNLPEEERAAMLAQARHRVSPPAG
jgi:amino acid adenylation domain-containing protein